MNAGDYFHGHEKLGTLAVKCFFEKELDKCCSSIESYENSNAFLSAGLCPVFMEA